MQGFPSSQCNIYSCKLFKPLKMDRFVPKTKTWIVKRKKGYKYTVPIIWNSGKVTAEGHVLRRFKSCLLWQWKETEIPVRNGMCKMFILMPAASMLSITFHTTFCWFAKTEKHLQWAFNVHAILFMSTLHEGFLKTSLGI